MSFTSSTKSIHEASSSAKIESTIYKAFVGHFIHHKVENYEGKPLTASNDLY